MLFGPLGSKLTPENGSRVNGCSLSAHPNILYKTQTQSGVDGAGSLRTVGSKIIQDIKYWTQLTSLDGIIDNPTSDSIR